MANGVFFSPISLQADDRGDSDQAITFTANRTLSSASTILPDYKEEEEEEEEYLVGYPDMEEGPSFRLGSVSRVKFVYFTFSCV